MKVFLVCLLSSFLLFPIFSDATKRDHLPTAEDLQFEQFVSFTTKFNKRYDSQDEHNHRYKIFKQNLALIEKHNAEAAEGKHSFTLGATPFADMTNEEYRKRVLGYRPKQNSVARSAAELYRPTLTLADAPSSLDWRDKGVVTDVKDQGQCGSCWSFSAVCAMEGAHALATGNLIAFSEQELVDCVNNGADTCSVGGEMHDGYLWAIKAGGMETESAYPYSATSGGGCKFDKSKSVATFSSYKNVTSGDENALLLALLDRPTISVGIDASSIWFQLYSGGVYDDSSCKNTWDQLDHGVSVVGYGHDDSTNKDFWIVKNSWGAGWGLKGYINMRRNSNNQCGISTDATFPLI